MTTTRTTRSLHVYFVLDRSGSMHAMASDVVGGFNSFLATQRANGRDALMTLVQFDSENTHEVLADALPLNEVAELTAETFVPRGGTPLYDAIGHAIADATIRAEQRRNSELPPEEIMFVTYTDGEENRSVEYTSEQIRELIKKREGEWSFAYLGANQDSYAEGGQIGYSSASTQNFAADAVGTRAAFASLDSAVSKRRQKIRAGESFDRLDVFEGDKAAEEDLNRRSS